LGTFTPVPPDHHQPRPCFFRYFSACCLVPRHEEERGGWGMCDKARKSLYDEMLEMVLGMVRKFSHTRSVREGRERKTKMRSKNIFDPRDLGCP